MKVLIYVYSFLISVNLCAQQPIEIPLWPNGTPNSNQLTGEEEWSGSRVKNVTEPTISIYKSDLPNSTAIIMCPGGGYAYLAMGHEGMDMAAWFISQHITYVVLKYRMPNGNHDVPLSDAEQAIRYIRQHADQYNVNPNKVGIMGASAGGHLASTLATHYSSKETRPDFQILLYPVITLNTKYKHPGSRDNLLGKNPIEELVDKYSNEKQVTEDTPKAFIALSTHDRTVTAENSIDYFLALKNKGVSASLHAYPIKRHGWGFNDGFAYKRQWTEELEKWLREEVN